MEIHGNDLLLSANDIHYANSGALFMDNPEFSVYVAGLRQRLYEYEPPEVSDKNDPLIGTVSCIPVAFSKKVVELLGQAIAIGATFDAASDIIALQAQADMPAITTANKAKYKAEERAKRKSKLTLIKDEDA